MSFDSEAYSKGGLIEGRGLIVNNELDSGAYSRGGLNRGKKPKSI